MSKKEVFKQTETKSWGFRNFPAHWNCKKMRMPVLERIPRVWLENHSVKRLWVWVLDPISHLSKVRTRDGIIQEGCVEGSCLKAWTPVNCKEDQQGFWEFYISRNPASHDLIRYGRDKMMEAGISIGWANTAIQLGTCAILQSWEEWPQWQFRGQQGCHCIHGPRGPRHLCPGPRGWGHHSGGPRDRALSQRIILQP